MEFLTFMGAIVTSLMVSYIIGAIFGGFCDKYSEIHIDSDIGIVVAWIVEALVIATLITI